MGRKGKIHNEKRKVVLLLVLLLTLTGVLGWQWANRDQGAPYVQDETEHRALATFMEMLEAGRVRGWSNTEKYWRELPERPMQIFYQQLMGSRFRTEFVFQGSAPVEGEPEQLLLYGMFDAGVPVEVRMSRNENEFKVISMKKM